MSRRHKLTRLKRSLFSSASLLIVVFLLLLVNLYARLILKERHLHALKSGARQLFLLSFPEAKNIVDENAQIKAKIQEIKSSAVKLDGILADTEVLTIIRELSIRVPTRFRVDVDEIIIEGAVVRLAGRVDTPLAVQGLVRELSGSTRFVDVNIEQSQEAKDTGIYFKIKLNVI